MANATSENSVGKKLTELKVVELRSELEKRSLDKLGIKDVLLERLKKALESEGKIPGDYLFAESELKSKVSSGRLSRNPVSIMEWTKLERAFAVEAFFSSGRSIVATQRAFRRHFNIAPCGRVPGRQSIVLWVNNFRETGDVKKKNPGLPRTARSPQNIDAVRQSVLRSPQLSARKHASALGLSARSVRRILHEELKFHPYKLAMVQELNPRDFIARENANK